MLALMAMLLACLPDHLAVEPTEGPQLVDILLVKHDMPAGAKVRKPDLVAISLPVPWVPDGIVRRPEEIVGSTVIEPLYTEEFLSWSRLEGGAPPDTLDPAHRVVALELSHPEPLPLPQPGHWVDLVRNGDPPCVRVEAVPVIAGITPDGDVHTTARSGPLYAAVRIAIPGAVAGTLAPAELTMWVRGDSTPHPDTPHCE